jgi:hypothetical protein
MRAHRVCDSFNAVTSRELRSLHVTSRFPVLALQYTERIDVILRQNSILVGLVLNICCAVGVFNSRKRIPVNRAYKS